MENLKIKLNINTFFTYERLTNKSFNSIDYSSQDDAEKLLYCCFVANNKYKITLDNFNKMLKEDEQFAGIITALFQEEIEFSQQFKHYKEDIQSEQSNTETNNYYIKDLIPLLVINCNLGIEYVLYELEIDNIPLFINSYNDQIQNKAEMDRLWAYLGILPHIDNKKLKSPKDLLKFPWESKIEEDILKDWDAARLDDILNSNTKQDDGK